jgi:DNA-binding response OmpR family regulator
MADNILVVHEKQHILDIWALYLQYHDYTYQLEQQITSALVYLKKHHTAVVLMDINLLEKNGWILCREIKQILDIPVIIMTACHEKKPIIKAIQSGADDFVINPINESDLSMRIDVWISRSKSGTKVEVNGLCLQEDCHKLIYNNHSIKLTPKEFKIIGCMMKQPNQVFAREQLIEMLWGYHANTEERTIDSHVKNMRDKIRASGFPIDHHFKTVWGVGYQWVG